MDNCRYQEIKLRNIKESYVAAIIFPKIDIFISGLCTYIGSRHRFILLINGLMNRLLHIRNEMRTSLMVLKS